jgi:myo-inositol-1(or 4)-monophosphatase
MFKTILDQTVSLCKETGLLIKTAIIEAKKSGSQAYSLKSFNQLVTEYDIAAEKRLTTGLAEIFPQAGFLTEEKTVDQTEKEFLWVIDPIDGTTNFVRGIPVFCISVALVYNHYPQVGVIYELNQDEIFAACKDGGATLNGKSISVSDNTELKSSLLATGFPYYDYDRINGYIDALKLFLQLTQGVRRLGSAAADLAYVACGRFDGFFEYGLSPWDVAAGILLIEEAGGKVSDFKNEDNALYGSEIIAANQPIHEIMLGIIKEAGL